MKRTTSLLLCLILLLMSLCACGDSESEIIQKEKSTTKAEVSTEAETVIPAETVSGEAQNASKPQEVVPSGADNVSTAFDYKAEYLEIIDVFERDFGKIPEGDTFSIGSGLYYANLVDFDKNDTPELVLGHMGVGDEYFEMKYTIYAVIDEKVECVESGNLYTTGGPDPSVYICYGEDCAYFVTGTSQSYTVNDYLKFDGEKFESVFSFELGGYEEDGAVDCKLNGEAVSYTELMTAMEEFDEGIVKSDNFFFGWDRNETVERLEATKDALKK